MSESHLQSHLKERADSFHTNPRTKRHILPIHLQLLISGAALLSGAPHLAAAGASTPFRTLEAESATCGGGAAVHVFTIGSPLPSVATPELEASGGGYVELTKSGDSITWNNPVANANAIVIRSSIPDAPSGGGVTATLSLYFNGILRQKVTVSSKQSWTYRHSKTSPDDPNGGGMPFKFYNEDRAFITGSPIPAGSKIMLRKDADNTAAFYRIDCVDVESVAPPAAQPANFLSVADYGADPTFATDSTAAIQKCVNDARKLGKSVWIPPGKFMLNNVAAGGLDFNGVTVAGAGVWHSMLYRNIPLPPPSTPWRSDIKVRTNTVLRDVSIDSNSIFRAIGGASGDDYGISAQGSNWLIERVWVQHCDANWLSGSDGVIRDSRVADSWGDGINLNNGNMYNAEKLGMRLTAQNNFVRGTGDDGIATYSDAGPSGNNSQMDGAKILNNTIVAPWWANGLRVAGGKNVLVQGNLVTDPASNNGMDISIFGSTGQPLESATVTGNVVLRGGGWNSTNRHGVSVGFPSKVPNTIVVSNNFVGDSRRSGIAVNTKLTELTLEGNLIDNPAAPGIQIASGSVGSASLLRNAVTRLRSGQAAFVNSGGMTTSLNANSWQTEPAIANGTYQMIARHSGLALNVAKAAANGSALDQRKYGGGDRQRWTVTQVGGNAYKIACVVSGRALETSGGSAANGAAVQLGDWLNRGNQTWLITPAGEGSYSIISVDSGKALEVVGGAGAKSPGAPVGQGNWTGAANQRWSFAAP